MLLSTLVHQTILIFSYSRSYISIVIHNRQENKMPVATEPRSYPSSLEQRLTNPLEAAGVKSGGNQTQLYLTQREPARLQGWSAEGRIILRFII